MGRCALQGGQADLAFSDVIVAEYLTFMETMARADINVFIQ
jgi:ABC-type amino acid transport substrate-binding protein